MKFSGLPLFFFLLLFLGCGGDVKNNRKTTKSSLGVIKESQNQITVDDALPSYQTTSGVSGNLNSVGSDTLNNLMALWTEKFRTIYPNVNIQIEGKGSSTAPPALIEGVAQLGPMSRKMKEVEIDKFEKKFGYAPTVVTVGIDALAVFVHKDNPMRGASMKQIDSIFSSTFKLGGVAIKTWGDAGVKDVAWANRPISLYGRNSASGTYGFFKKVALGKGDYNLRVKEQLGSSAVIQGVASDLYGIGYSGVGYKTSGARILPISLEGVNYKEASQANCLSGDYPLTRFLYVYVNKAPGQKLDTLTTEFVKFVISKEGQKIVTKDGYYPLPATKAEQVRKELNL